MASMSWKNQRSSTRRSRTKAAKYSDIDLCLLIGTIWSLHLPRYTSETHLIRRAWKCAGIIRKRYIVFALCLIEDPELPQGVRQIRRNAQLRPIGEDQILQSLNGFRPHLARAEKEFVRRQIDGSQRTYSEIGVLLFHRLHFRRRAKALLTLMTAIERPVSFV
jgi:hypothetical protein